MEDDIEITPTIVRQATRNGFVNRAEDINAGDILIQVPKKRKKRDSEGTIERRGSDYPLHRSEEPTLILREKANIPKARKIYLFKRCRSFEASLREMGLWEEAMEYEREELALLKRRRKTANRSTSGN